MDNSEAVALQTRLAGAIQAQLAKLPSEEQAFFERLLAMCQQSGQRHRLASALRFWAERLERLAPDNVLFLTVAGDALRQSLAIAQEHYGVPTRANSVYHESYLIDLFHFLRRRESFEEARQVLQQMVQIRTTVFGVNNESTHYMRSLVDSFVRDHNLS